MKPHDENGSASRLVLVPAFRDDVAAMVRRVHRHHRPPVGYLFAVAVADAESGAVVGVASVGRPSAEPLQDGWTCEVTRTATDGTPNANSCLYGAAWRAARALGYRRAVTYTQDGETGASLRGAGWVPAAELPARAGWDGPASRRADRHPLHVDRTRWEVTVGSPPWQQRPRPAPALEPQPLQLPFGEAS